MMRAARERADVVILVEEWPWPTFSGSQQRTLAVIDAVQRLDLSVALASFGPPTVDIAEEMRSFGILVPGSIYPGHWADESVGRSRYWTERITGVRFPLHTVGTAPMGARRWLDGLVHEFGAHATIVSHFFRAWIGARHRTRAPVVRILDLMDLLTLNGELWRAVEAGLGARPVEPAEVDPAIVDVNFMARVAAKPDPRELALARQFDLTLAIDDSEAQLVASECPGDRVRWTPHTPPPCVVNNRYGPHALMVMGNNNPFNVQGYAWLAREVMPRVLARDPKFELIVAGNGSRAVGPVPGVTLAGTVDDLAPLYAEARVTLCPLLAGTGQPTKVLESLAYGVPVVASGYAGSRTPITDGIDGFVEADAQHFADRVLQLGQSPELARHMGERGRAKTAERFADDALGKALAEVLARRPTASP